MAMLNLIDGLRLSDNPITKDKIGKKKKKNKDDKDEGYVYDGLVVDYTKFCNLTKGMLQNANAIRQKSIKAAASPRPMNTTYTRSGFENTRLNSERPSASEFSRSGLNSTSNAPFLPSTPIMASMQHTGNIRSPMNQTGISQFGTQRGSGGTIAKQRPAVTFSKPVVRVNKL